MKKIFLIGTSAVVLTWATPILTNDTDTVVSRSGDVLVDSVNKKGIFQWLEGGFGYTDKKLSYDLTAFKVLRENKSAVRYLQTSLRRKGAKNTFNIGFGTRNAINDARTTLIGANIFIDSKDGAGKFYTFGSKVYKRLSLGLELKTGAFDLSANMYRPMGSAVILGRKVMKGFDMTAKGNLTDTLNIGLNTYKFDGVASKVEQGNKLIVEYKPNSTITIRGEYDKPKSSSAQTNVYAGFKFAFGTSNTRQQNSGGTAWDKRYDKVERSYEVKTAAAVLTDSLSIANLVVPYSGSGSKVVSSSDILAKLTIDGGQTQKSDWSITNMENTDRSSNITIANDKNSLTITGAISSPGTTITIVLTHATFGDVTQTFKLTTAAGQLSESGQSRSGAGKWGKTITTNYHLKTSDTVGDKTETFKTGAGGDFTFKIIPPGGDGNSGLTQTTAGIVSGALTGAIGLETGIIDGTKLTKSGTLLVKITRKAKGALPELSKHMNVTINRQVLGTDVTAPTASSTDPKWKDSANTPINITYSNFSAGTTQSDFDWSVKAKTGDAPDGTLNTAAFATNPKQLKGATSSGKAVITITAKSGDAKYTGSVDLADFQITRQDNAFVVATKYQALNTTDTLSTSSRLSINTIITTRPSAGSTLVVSDQVAPGSGWTTVPKYPDNFVAYDANSGGSTYNNWNAVKSAIATNKQVHFTLVAAASKRATVFTVEAQRTKKYDAKSYNVYLILRN